MATFKASFICDRTHNIPRMNPMLSTDLNAVALHSYIPLAAIGPGGAIALSLFRFGLFLFGKISNVGHQGTFLLGQERQSCGNFPRF